MTNIAIMAPDAASAGYGPNGGLATSIKYATITTEQNPYMGAKGVNAGLGSIKYATITTEQDPYMGAKGVNAGLTSLTYATITTEKDPYKAAIGGTRPASPRPASGQLWPRFY